MTQSLAVGIDLGTSCSAVALFDEVGRTAMFRNPQGDLLIASIVFFEDEELVFGSAAKQAAAITPQLAAEWVKRDLGQPAYSRAIGGELLRPELVAACLLRQLVADLAATGGHPPAVVLAVPACFHQSQRLALLDAAAIAGLDLLGVIDEPLAAALAFAESQGYLKPDGQDKSGCRALVFDLGGGKLDVAIVEIKPHRLRTLALGGDPRLGGRDWDARVADHLGAQYEQQFGQDPRYDMVSVRRLQQTAEETKHALSARTQARAHVERGGDAIDLPVTRHEFEQATADLVERAKNVAEQVLTRAGLAWRDVAHLLLVGGATRMPMISHMLETLTGLKHTTSIHADEAVARGAALVAEQLLAHREHRASKVDFQIAHLTAHSLGLEWQNRDARRTENVVLIPRGTELPCATTSTASPDAANPSAITLQLVEGEGRNIDQCMRIAKLTISGLPNGSPAQAKVEVQYRYTAEGRLQTRAQLQGSSQALSVEVEREHGLTAAQLSKWKELLKGPVGLKQIHSRLDRPHSMEIADRPTTTAPLSTRERGLANDEAHARTGSMPPERELPHGAGSQPPPLDQVQLQEIDDSFVKASKKRSNNPRTLQFHLLNLTGYIVFSLIGLVVGYYILMVLRPEWNTFHLRIPGLRPPASASDALPVDSPP